MQPEALPGFLQSLGPLVSRHGYVVVAGFLFLEAFAIPVPGETVLLIAGLYAGTGRLNVLFVIVLGSVATLLGSCLGYLIGATGGRALVARYGRYVGLTERRFAAAAAFFQRQGPKIVVLARFVEGTRQANGILAGISEMTFRRFLIFNAIGAVLWVTTWTLVCYLAGTHIGAVYSGITRYIWVALGVAILAIAFAVFRYRHHHAKAPVEADALETSGE